MTVFHVKTTAVGINLSFFLYKRSPEKPQTKVLDDPSPHPRFLQHPKFF